MTRVANLEAHGFSADAEIAARLGVSESEVAKVRARLDYATWLKAEQHDIQDAMDIVDFHFGDIGEPDDE